MCHLRSTGLLTMVGVLILLSHTTVVYADAHETSIHVEPMAGVALLGDPRADSTAPAVGLAGAAVRFTWSTRNWLAWEVEASGAVSGIGGYDAVASNGAPVTFSRRAIVAGLDGGATARFGVRYIPTF